MGVIAKGAVAAILLTGATVAGTAPAQADRGTDAVIAGVAGLAIGAAIASDHHRHYYAEPVNYYGAPPVAYYGGGYDYAPAYAPAYGYGYRDRYDDRGRGYRRDNGWAERGYGHDGYDRGDRRGWDHDGRR